MGRYQLVQFLKQMGWDARRVSPLLTPVRGQMNIVQLFQEVGYIVPVVKCFHGFLPR
jgi:hypothetical protein